MYDDTYKQFLLDNDYFIDWSTLGVALANIALSALWTFSTFSAVAWAVRLAITY